MALAFAELSLFPAIREQVLESRRRTSFQWAKGLTMEEYILRDAIMDEHEHALGGKLITWVLAPRTNPETLDFMCSCETFRRTGLIANQSSTGQSQPVEVTAYGIASVFTPPSKRRKGYAQHMLHLLHWVLAPRSALPAVFPPSWGSPPQIADSFRTRNAHFSVLYSDIGGQFYRACGPDVEEGNGWLVSGARETVYIPETSVRQTTNVDTKWEWLTEDTVNSVWKRDVKDIKADMRAAAAASNCTLFSFLPHNGVGVYTIRRTMSFDSDRTPVLPTAIWGVLLRQDLDESGGEPQTFATWTLDVRDRPRTLVVTRIRATKSSFPQLLAKIVEAAQNEKTERIEIWGLREEWYSLAEELGWKTGERAEHLSAFKWYGRETDDEVEWMFNEKFCWC
ncbi:hypothetical protein BKA93DRAFT_788521 [Sparassis latifolia]|uniref:LYC1 C-terminal domain-containing protein n=1 Tax=Sparassis crispa TaxID=139825 RepID=A0A401H3K2_9APHY|nr:hypothetical protein SCP_1500100 [Sparassis crispa]GBE89008.1 hypothetical protein SCP_1500100 [Sparassis crispa]